MDAFALETVYIVAAQALFTDAVGLMIDAHVVGAYQLQIVGGIDNGAALLFLLPPGCDLQ